MMVVIVVALSGVHDRRTASDLSFVNVVYSLKSAGIDYHERIHIRFKQNSLLPRLGLRK